MLGSEETSDLTEDKKKNHQNHHLKHFQGTKCHLIMDFLINILEINIEFTLTSIFYGNQTAWSMFRLRTKPSVISANSAKIKT